MIYLKHFQANDFWAISRRSSLYYQNQEVFYYHQDMCFKFVGSHDIFIFQPKVKESVVKGLTGIFTGRWGYENVIVWEFSKAGYVLKNPCTRINIWHYQLKDYPKANHERVNQQRSSYIQPSPVYDISKILVKDIVVPE